MKTPTLLQLMAALFIAGSVSASASENVPQGVRQIVRLVPEFTFIPTGFDDNDNVRLTVYGNLPNTCYKAGTATAQVDLNTKTIYIQNLAYVYGGRWCAEVLVPYMHTINLGILPEGQYQVYVQDKQDILHGQGILNVAGGAR